MHDSSKVDNICDHLSNGMAGMFIAEMFIRNESRWASAFLLTGISTVAISISEYVMIPEQVRASFANYAMGLAWELACVIPPLAMMYRRRLALHEAMEAVKQDQARYDDAWRPVKAGHEVALRKLSKVVDKHQNVKKVQRVQSLDMLYCLASRLNDWYQTTVGCWAQQCNAELRRAPLKTPRRAMEKIYRSYFGNVPPLLDLVRSSIVVDTIDEAMDVLELVLADAIVHTIKNRMDVDYDGNETAGYRDLNVQVGFQETDGTVFEGFVFELQIHLRAVIDMKTDFGHKRYVALRNLRGD